MGMHASRPLTWIASSMLLTLGLFAAAPSAQAKDVTFVIEARNFAFSPAFLQVDPGDVVTIIVFNNETGVIPHTFDLDAYGVHLGSVSNPIPSGQNRSATFTADEAGTLYFYCSIPGHATNQGGGRWTGMAGRLQVGEAPPPGDATPVIVGGLVVLFASLGAIAYAVRRKKKA